MVERGTDDKRLFIGQKVGQSPAYQSVSEWEAAKVRATGRLLSVLALALLLAGCDKCGGWFGMHAPSSLGVCKNTVPQQR
jgi:hypothetical protein